MSNTRNIALCEQQVIGTLYNNLELLDSEINSHFVTTTGSAIFKALVVLQEKSLEPSIRSLYLHAVKNHDKLKLDHLDFLKEDISNYTPSNLLTYIQDLKKYKLVDSLQNVKLDDLTVDLSKKSLNYDSLESKLEGMLHDINLIKSESGIEEDEVKFLNREDETKEFAKIIEKRKLGEHYPSGCSYLDEYLYNNSLLPQEITILFGNSGSGKTSFNRNLVERRIVKSLPTLEIALEMSLESSLDSKMGIRAKVDRSNFSFNSREDAEGEEGSLDNKYDLVDKIIEKELKKAKRYTNYLQLNLDSLNISNLRKYIIKAKKLIGLQPKDYMLVTIDLMTMIEEFNLKGSKASNYEDAMNLLHALVKELNIHLVGLVQNKRSEGKVVINSLSDVEKLRPNTESLKNSGALEERARVIIGIFRAKHVIEKYLPEDPALDYMEDVMEARILKQNSGSISPNLYYLFNPRNGLLYAYPTYNPDSLFAEDEKEEDD